MHRLVHGDLLTPSTKGMMLALRPYGAGVDAPADSGYGLGVMIEPACPGDQLAGHAGQGLGSTIAVFSTLIGQRTFTAALDTDAPETIGDLIDYLKTLV